jgi:phospholipid/cholesterol/gamma-HCH transport system permease protein
MNPWLLSLVNRFSTPVLNVFQETGKIFILFGQIFLSLFRLVREPAKFRKFYYRLILEQMVATGVNSIPVVVTTALFTGMVLAVQTGVTMESKLQGASIFVGSIVNLALIRELGPVLTGLLVTGRVGSAMAAEIGTMKITEQVDALRTLATNPVEYLAMPRFVAVMLMMPMLSLMADVLGSLGGWAVATFYLGVNSHVYWYGAQVTVHMYDVFTGLAKSVVFGIILCIFALHRGFETFGGAEGVGRATTGAVVNASITLLITDYFLTQAFALF